MRPSYKNGEQVLALHFFKNLKINDVVVLKNPHKNVKEKYIIKRIAKVSKEKYFVLGDNSRESTDSRAFGWIEKKDIAGKVVYSL